MLIDWFTVGAQIINFLILVWLLKRFLYKPILAAMDAREKQIDGNLHAAAEQKALAEKERADYQQQCQELERRKAEIIKQAEDEATREKQQLLNDAREEAAALRAKWRAALQSEQEGLGSALARNAAREVYATARCLLADLADAGLEERMVDTFIRRLHTLDCNEKARITAALNASHEPPVLRSAFALPPQARAALEQELRAQLDIQGRIAFQTMPDLLAGLELAADGSKVAWSFASCLSGLERSLSAALETEQVADVNG